MIKSRKILFLMFFLTGVFQEGLSQSNKLDNVIINSGKELIQYNLVSNTQKIIYSSPDSFFIQYFDKHNNKFAINIGKPYYKVGRDSLNPFEKYYGIEKSIILYINDSISELISTSGRYGESARGYSRILFSPDHKYLAINSGGWEWSAVSVLKLESNELFNHDLWMYDKEGTKYRVEGERFIMWDDKILLSNPYVEYPIKKNTKTGMDYKYYSIFEPENNKFYVVADTTYPESIAQKLDGQYWKIPEIADLNNNYTIQVIPNTKRFMPMSKIIIKEKESSKIVFEVPLVSPSPKFQFFGIY